MRELQGSRWTDLRPGQDHVRVKFASCQEADGETGSGQKTLHGLIRGADAKGFHGGSGESSLGEME